MPYNFLTSYFLGGSEEYINFTKTSNPALWSNNTLVSVTGTTAETSLRTFTLTAGTMGPTDYLHIMVHWEMTNNANNKTFRLNFGGTSYINYQVASQAGVQRHARIYNRNSTTSQIGSTTANSQIGYGLIATPTTSSVDTSSDVVIEVTGQLANAADTLSLRAFTILLYKCAYVYG